jgi:hypothetical protein
MWWIIAAPLLIGTSLILIGILYISYQLGVLMEHVPEED